MDILVNKNVHKDEVLLYFMKNDGSAFCMLNYYKQEKHIMFLSNLNVNIESRGKGLGSCMMNNAILYAKSSGCKYLYLEVIHESSWVFDWYERLGFKLYRKDGDSCYMFKEL